jgi:phosphatidylinositol dimannoside acyltransferase
VSGIERRLEAPHRRLAPGPRLLEKGVVHGYRATSWLLSHVPEVVGRAVVGTGGQLSYLAWPSKRRWSNDNFGHVLGLPPDHPRVRRLALAAYREYGRYIVELMRLPGLGPDKVGALVDDSSVDGIEPIWRESKGGLIFAVGHVGNNEAVAAGIARRGWPINVVADDTSFPEMFELLSRQRESWGVRIIAWRKLREIYGVLRRREMLALLVDWGYRSDGIPVRLFDAWTTLPAGPATLAARTGSRILPIAIRRRAGGRFEIRWSPPIEVASTEPADLVRATQAMADALQTTIAAAPEQWYNFKPIWPATAAESRELELRAAAALAGRGPATLEPPPGVVGTRPPARDEHEAVPAPAPKPS